MDFDTIQVKRTGFTEDIMNTVLADSLEEIVGSEHIKYSEPMARHTSFKVGGPADILICPADARELSDAVAQCRKHQIPYYILGNGSNLLVRDGGYRGVVIDMTRMNGVCAEGTRVRAQSGATLKDAAQMAQRAGLTGLEFACGIPGTVGGGVRMNAGAYDGELKNVIASIDVLTPEGEILTLDNPACHFGYRHSIIQEAPYIVLSAVFELAPGERAAIQEKMDDLNRRRAEKQPLEYPSAGSTFRRPQGYFAGKLIQDIGFKGKQVGGAQVSEKHSGFVINRGNATAQDILTLIAMIQHEVKQQFGVDIQREVIVIGE